MSVSPHEVQELRLGVAPHLVVRHPLHLLRARVLPLQVLGPPAPDTRRAPAPELEHALNKLYQKLQGCVMIVSIIKVSAVNEILRQFSQYLDTWPLRSSLGRIFAKQTICCVEEGLDCEYCVHDTSMTPSCYL